MQYRKMGKLDFDVSNFGMGLMRLPTAEGNANIRYELSTPLIHKAFDMGVNYFDTAYVYHGGNSEVALGKALKEKPGMRDKIKIATKLPLRDGGTPESWEAVLDESLTRMGIETVDFYLLHGINGESFKKFGAEAVPFLEKMVEKGKIRYPSFSFHDDFDAFKTIIDAYDGWCMAQVQFNLMDTFNQATLEGIRYAGKKNIPIVVMEPLRGGMLAKHVPDPVKALYEAFPDKRTPVEWAFRYVYNQPEVKVVLSGIGTPEELEQNVATFSAGGANVMNADEEKLIENVRKAYEGLAKIGCTGCRYCEPGCPMNIAIPDIFKGYDNACIAGNINEKGPFSFQGRYQKIVENDRGASKCIQCGQCEGECPQHISIIEHLANIAKEYEK
ncbi:MAG: aldo/keto reductase [Clostridia bacterium]|nr:aldo/keto reductase [Clostridia bacterium]